MKHLLPALALSLLLGCSPTLNKSHLFPLGLWYEGGVGNARDNVLPDNPKLASPIYSQNFADIAAHGINVVVVPNSPPDHHKPLLDAALAHHLLVIPELGLDGGATGNAIRSPQPLDEPAIKKEFATVLDPIKNHPAFYRLQLLDEPAPGTPTQHYAQVAALLKSHDPAVKPFTCLAGPGPVHDFAQAVHPDVTAFDFYPFGPAKPANDIPSLRDFESASRAAVAESAKANADCYAVIQCFALTGATRYPLPSEIRAMTWISLGSGAKGLFWFLYQSQRLPTGQVMDGLVDRDFNPRPAWDEIAHLTKVLKPLTPTLQDLHPSKDEKPTIIRRKSMYPMTDSKGRNYLLAINVDPAVNQTLHLSLKTPATKVFRLPDHKEIPSARKADTLTWHEDFAPGSGALYRVE